MISYMHVRRAMGVAVFIGFLSILFFFHKHTVHTPVVETAFFLPETFVESDRSTNTPQEQSDITAVVVPHHLIAGEPLARIFKLLRTKGYTRVFIIGPNHYDQGHANILTATVDVDTSFGIQKGNRWINAPDIPLELLKNEHSIMGIMPYVAYYLDAQTQPLILKAKTANSELETLADQLAKESDSRTIIIFSVDFSHYLPREIAERNDQVTAKALLAMDEQVLYDMNNDYIDSPPSLVLMMKLCKKAGARFTIVDHTNSADLLGQPNLLSTTSHFTGYCAR